MKRSKDYSRILNGSLKLVAPSLTHHICGGPRWVGVAAKTILFQIAKGDQSANNPSTTAIIRRATLTTNPHGFAVSVGNAIFKPIASRARPGRTIRLLRRRTGHVPQPSQFFEFPILLPFRRVST